MKQSECTLVIFCKRPSPGQGKQRIAATLGKDAACEVASALLQCALEDAERWPGPVVLSPASDEDIPWAEQLLQRSCGVVSQPAGNLGQRLQSVDGALRQQGHTFILFTGTDAPEHSEALFAEVRALLVNHDVVLTPADDGGVTVMASKNGWPDLQVLPWSTERLGQSLANSCMLSGREVVRSSNCRDVDQETDLRRLQDTLSTDTRPARRQLFNVINSLLN
ncbi:MAG: DUF2064 domain-containing protein [Amphritea sp.]